MISLLKKLLPHHFKQAMKRKLFVVQDMNTRLRNLQRAGFEATGLVDAGAYEGEWTREAWNIWPAAPSAMVEPLPAQTARLEKMATHVKSSTVIAKALSSKSGVTHFHLSETNSGITSDEQVGETIEVECTTLDEIVTKDLLFTPNMLKLDLQGHELEAMRGAKGCLNSFEVILLEISILQIGPVPIFREVDQFMEKQGYRFYDVIPQYYRPLDGALWQIDAFYVRENSTLFASRDWQ